MDPLPAYMRTAAIRIAAAGLNSVGGGVVKGNSRAENLMNGMMMNYAAKHNMTLGQMADMQNEIGQFYTGLSLVKGWHEADYNKLYNNVINNMNASHGVIDQVTRGSIREAENNWGVLGISGVVATMVAVEGGMPQSVGSGPKGFQNPNAAVGAQRVSLKYNDPQPNGVNYGYNISDGKLNINGRAVTNGTFDYVITNSGELRIGSGHYYLSNGAESVQMAGRLKIWNGNVKPLNGNSGHYRPTAAQTQRGNQMLQNIVNGKK